MSSQKNSFPTSSCDNKAEFSSKAVERPPNSDGERVQADEGLLKAESFKLCCVQCGSEETKEKALLVCSRCKQTRYCSKECQLIHYPLHRAPCRRNALAHEQAEHTVLANPVVSYATQDSEKHLQSISGEAMVAARSALHLGKLDSLAQSHVLIIRFEYDRRPLLLRDRFKFMEVVVRSFEDHLKISPQSLHASIRRIMPSSNTVPRSFWTPDDKDGYYIRLIHETTFLMDGRMVHMPQHLPLVISPDSSFSIYDDYHHLHLNPHWQEALRWSLSRPVRNLSLLILEDLYMSEGKVIAEGIIEHEGKEMDRLIRSMALVKAEVGTGEGALRPGGKKVKDEEKALHSQFSHKAVISQDDFHPAVRALMGDGPSEREGDGAGTA